MAASATSIPTALQRAAPLFRDAEMMDAVRAVFAPADRGGFRVYLDDACAMPADWRAHRFVSSCNSTPARRMAQINDNKYGAESFIPHALADSPYVTADWRRANASIVVIYPHAYGGPVNHCSEPPTLHHSFVAYLVIGRKSALQQLHHSF